MSPDWRAIGSLELLDGTPVRRVGFGGAWLTGPGTYGPPPDLHAARDVVRRAVDEGFQLVDTADCYGPEISESLIAEALHPYPDDVLVSTKGGRLALGDNRWQPDGRPEHLRAACEASLRRLRLETIDLYQLNAVDPDVPIEESLGALVELGAAGKVRAIGVCNVDLDQLARARAVTAIASVQDRYDLLTRSNDPVLDACARDGVAFLAWFPPANELLADPGSALARVAAEHDALPAQICLAWLLARSPALVPLPGTADPARFAQDLAALELALTAEQVKQLSEAAEPLGR